MPRDAVEINISLLAHIAADAELQGRFGVQGQNFLNTIGYLKQYLEAFPENNTPELSQLLRIVSDLHERTQIIQALANSTVSPEKLGQFCTDMAKQIAALNVGNDELMLPGGWCNAKLPGHAMIYHFKRQENNTLRFYIYNAGAGVKYHDKVSFAENERYFSTKVYEFPADITQKQLSELVERLIVARVPHLREGDFDEAILYLQNIEEIIPHITDLTRTKPVLASELFDEVLTTTGQISGTCTQRSIHQMLKHHFPTIEIYRHFIIDFKIHAIKDYLSKYTRDGKLTCSPNILDLINSAITNTIKICDTDNLFKNQDNKIEKLQILYNLQDQLHYTAIPPLVSVASTVAVDKKTYSYQLATNTTVPTITITGNPLFNRHLIVRQDVRISINLARSIVMQLTDLLEQCHEQFEVDPLWVMKQIEQASLDLVLPTSFIPTSFIDPMPQVYRSIVQETEQYERCRDTLIELQRIYDTCRQRELGIKQVTSQNVVQLSLLAFQDYLSWHHCRITKRPSFNELFIRHVHQILYKNCWNAYLGTHDPTLDNRWVALRRLYQQDTNRRQVHSMTDYFKHYNALLALYPNLFEELASRYIPVNNPEFEKEIKIQNVRELFVFCNELKEGIPKPGSFLNESQWQPLVKTIQEQLAFEAFVIKTLSSFFNKPLQFNPTLSIDYCEYLKKIKFQEPLLQAFDSTSNFSNTALNQQYVLEDSPLKKALTSDVPSENHLSGLMKNSSNKIQLLSHDARMGRVINKDDFFIRDLFHLRTSPDHQVNLTLDYFHAARHHLMDLDVQRYVEANLFEPGLLSKTLEKDPTFLARFDRFICSGINEFINVNNEIKPEGLFFIRLSLLVSRYVTNNHVTRLQDELVRLNDLIVTNRDEHMLAALHHYRFLTFIAINKLQPLDGALFDEALISYFKIQAKGSLFVPHDVETLFELKQAQRAFQTCIANRSSRLNKDKIGTIVSGLDPVFAGYQLEGDYPDYELVDDYRVVQYTVYVDLGAVFKQNQKYSPVPLDLFQSNMVKQLGVDTHSSCLVSPDGDVVEFIKPDGNIRLIRMVSDGFNKGTQPPPKDKWIVQQQLTLHDVTAWYQLMPTTDYQQHTLKLKAKILQHGLPEAIVDGATLVWQQCDAANSVFILTKENEITYYTDNQELKTSNGCSLKTIPAWNQFEDNRFVLNMTDNGVSRVSFERYGFSLEAKGSDFVYLPRPSLVLQPNASVADMPDVSCLRFKETQKEAEATTEREYLLVPVQSFYYDTMRVLPNANGELYRFKQDTTNHVASQRLKMTWDFAHLPMHERPSWYYKNTCQSILYALVDGKPVPEKAADGLYLCYLYLANGQSEQAWQVLEALQQRLPLEGNVQELTYLEWIMNGLPVVLDPNDKDATREMPDYGACQLKALSLLTTFLDRDKKIQLPDSNVTDTSTANAQAKTQAHQRLNEFYNTLTDTVYWKLNRYFATKRHLRKPFYLDETSQQSLLNYYTSHGSSALGSLGYQQRAASLKTLSQELKLLDAVVLHSNENPTSTDFIPMDGEAVASRVQQIHDEVAQLQDVMKRTTVVEQVAIDLSLPAGEFKINQALLSDRARRYCSTNEFVVDSWWHRLGTASSGSPENIAMAALSPNISQDDFFKYFPDYYTFAREPAHPYRQALRTFCEQYLIAHRHVSLDKQPTNIPILVNILYRTSCLRSQPTYNYSTLSDIAASLKGHTPTPIYIFQAQDVFKETLQTSEAIFQTMLAQTPNIEPRMPLLAVDDGLVTLSLKDMVKHEAFSAFCDAYQLSEQENETALKGILEKLPENPTFQELYHAEQQAGYYQYLCLQQQQQIALKLQNDDIRMRLSTIIEQKKHDWEIDLNRQLDGILSYANGVFEDPDKACDSTHAQRIQIARRTMQQSALTEKDLLNLYYRARRSEYQEKTGLSAQKIAELHQAIHEYAQKKLHVQHITRMQNALNDVNREPRKVVFLQSLASVLMSKNLPQAQQDPAIMRFQLEENILLRPRQLQAIQQLLSTPDENRYQFNEWVEKIIMGGGKSKVLLPLLAQKKATGLNLVVIEVPRALLATNYADLNATSQKLFNQTAHVFDFDRDSDCSSKRLTVIYNQLLRVITQKDYLITTGESIQSFRLKYIELLYARPKDGASPAEMAEWRSQVHIASKIVRLFKERADVVIDEVHEGLLLKKKLNYAFGEPDPISCEVVGLNISLYQFILQLCPLPSYDPMMDEQARVQSNERALRQGWLSLQAHFPKHLIEHPASPLKSYVDKLCRSQADKDALVLYLQDKAPCSFLENCGDKTILDAFAFFKAQQKITALTLSRRFNENYGPSQQASLSELKRMLALPYIGNGRANERSRFSNQLETMNYTIQSMLLTGLTPSLLKDIVQQWIMQARHEMMSSGHIRFAQTNVATGVHIAYLKELGITFEQLDVRDTELMERLYQGLRHNDMLLYDVLENHILPQINQERYVLSSNALNHASMYRSKQGVSGTPSNYHSFHQDLNFNPQTSLGTDGYIQALLNNKKTHVQYTPFTTLDAFLKGTLEGDDAANVRAIIDISATFTGYNNVSVARALAQFYQSPTPDIEYILYFDNTDKLCAISCRDPNAAPIILNTSDPKEITQKLGCPPEHRFTYYDQLHTVGVDIKQGIGSKALVLVDERTSLNRFLQGVMRMRGLESEAQEISIIAQNDLTLNEHLERMAANEAYQLKQDNFAAALEKIDNLIYDDCLKRVIACDDPERQAVLADKFRTYFIDTQTLDLYKRYGRVSDEMDTDLVLNNYKQQALGQWQTLLDQADITPTSVEMQKMQEKADAVIKQALPHCHQRVVWTDVKNDDKEYETEKEQEKEQQREEEQRQEEFFNPDFRQQKFIHWTHRSLQQFAEGTPITVDDNIGLMRSLSRHLPPGSDLSSTIQITANYQYVYENQQAFLSCYLKPVQSILFRRLRTGVITACIISNDELEEIGKMIASFPNVWVSNPMQTVLCGTRPADVLDNPEYHILMEQLCYFGGEMQILMNQDKPLTWLAKSPDKKLDYFAQHLMPYRKTKPDDLTMLRSIFSNAHAGYSYISEHAFEDLTNMNWKRQYDSLTQQALQSLKTLAIIYNDINYNLPHPIPTNATQMILARYPALPAAAIAYVEQHINNHRMLQLFAWLQTASADANDPPWVLKNGLDIDFQQLKKTYSSDFDWMQLHILITCLASPVFNKAIMHIRCISHHPLLHVVDLNTPLTSEHLILNCLQNDSIINLQVFTQILTYPQTTKTVEAIYTHRLFSVNTLTEKQLECLLPYCTNAMRFELIQRMTNILEIKQVIDSLSKNMDDTLFVKNIAFHASLTPDEKVNLLITSENRHLLPIIVRECQDNEAAAMVLERALLAMKAHELSTESSDVDERECLSQISENEVIHDGISKEDDEAQWPLTMMERQSIRQVIDDFKTRLILTLKETGVDISNFITELNGHNELFMQSKIDFATYKQRCEATLNTYQNQFDGGALTRNLTVFEHISEGFRALFHVLDKIIKIALGFQQTMAETYTPGAPYLVGRNNFFVKPDLETDLGKAMREFKETLDELEPNIVNRLSN